MLLPVSNTFLAFSIFRHVSKTYQPIIRDYVFNRQKTKVKLITFNSRSIKVLILMMDVFHITIACYAKSLANKYPAQQAVCEKTFPTFYGLSAFMVVLGMLFIFRCIYLLFPHLIGFLYFEHKQQEDRQRIMDSEEKEVPIFNFSHSYYEVTRKKTQNCQGCFKAFEETQAVAEIPCTSSHIMHKDCCIKWFNQQHHLNCPVCLEFIFRPRYRYPGYKRA